MVLSLIPALAYAGFPAAALLNVAETRYLPPRQSDEAAS